jgi:hypothetical protein
VGAVYFRVVVGSFFRCLLFGLSVGFPGYTLRRFALFLCTYRRIALFDIYNITYKKKSLLMHCLWIHVKRMI